MAVVTLEQVYQWGNRCPTIEILSQDGQQSDQQDSKTLWSWRTFLWWRDWTRWPLEVPSDPKHSTDLWLFCDLAPLKTASSPVWTSFTASTWRPSAGAAAHKHCEAFCWTHISSLILYWGTKNWHGLTNAEQGMITSQKELAMFLLTQSKMH